MLDTHTPLTRRDTTLNRVRAAAPARQRTGRAMRPHGAYMVATHQPSGRRNGPQARPTTNRTIRACVCMARPRVRRRRARTPPEQSSGAAVVALGRVPHCAGREAAAVAESGLRPRGLAAALLRSGTLPLTLSLTLTLTLAEDTPPPREHARPGRRAKLRSRAAPSSLALALTPNHA